MVLASDLMSTEFYRVIFAHVSREEIDLNAGIVLTVRFPGSALFIFQISVVFV